MVETPPFGGGGIGMNGWRAAQDVVLCVLKRRVFCFSDGLCSAVAARHHVEQEQAAVEIAVVERDFAFRVQAHQFGHVAVAGKHADGPACVVLLQPAAQLGVECVQGLDFGQAFAVGRVGQHDAALAVRPCVLRVAVGNVDEAVHFGEAGVLPCGAGHGAVVVGGGDVFRRPAAGGFPCLLFDALPQGGVVFLQFFKAETPHDAGCAVQGNERGFDGDGAAAAEGVLEGLAAVVSGQQQEAGGQVFAQRGFAGVLAVAAFEQGFARCVDEDLDGFVVEEGVYADVGSLFVHGRAFAEAVALAVAYRVFDFQADEGGVFDAGAFAFHMDFDAVRRGEPILPADVARGFVDVVFGAVGGFGQAQQHAAGGAAVQVGAVNLFEAAGAGDAAVGGGEVGAALGGKFGVQDAFQPARAGNE